DQRDASRDSRRRSRWWLLFGYGLLPGLVTGQPGPRVPGRARTEASVRVTRRLRNDDLQAARWTRERSPGRRHRLEPRRRVDRVQQVRRWNLRGSGPRGITEVVVESDARKHRYRLALTGWESGDRRCARRGESGGVLALRLAALRQDAVRGRNRVGSCDAVVRLLFTIQG